LFSHDGIPFRLFRQGRHPASLRASAKQADGAVGATGNFVYARGIREAEGKIFIAADAPPAREPQRSEAGAITVFYAEGNGAITSGRVIAKQSHNIWKAAVRKIPP
jgi:hypothetical protein